MTERVPRTLIDKPDRIADETKAKATREALHGPDPQLLDVRRHERRHGTVGRALRIHYQPQLQRPADAGQYRSVWKKQLMNGWDDIDPTRAERPWVVPSAT